MYLVDEVTLNKGTEPPFSGKYNDFFKDGFYYCIRCGNKLFESSMKFKSSCGWPSFDNVVSSSVDYLDDNSFGMKRIEVICKKCGSHLGHLFDDGPTKTGKRFCINSVSLNFKDKA